MKTDLNNLSLPLSRYTYAVMLLFRISHCIAFHPSFPLVYSIACNLCLPTVDVYTLQGNLFFIVHTTYSIGTGVPNFYYTYRYFIFMIVAKL